MTLDLGQCGLEHPQLLHMYFQQSVGHGGPHQTSGGGGGEVVSWL